MTDKTDKIVKVKKKKVATSSELDHIALEIMTPALGAPKIREFKSEKERWKEIKTIVKFYFYMKECSEFHLYKRDNDLIRMTMR